MSFKIFVFILLACSCGIKGDPASPKGQHLPSVLENYEDIKTQQPLDDSKIKK